LRSRTGVDRFELRVSSSKSFCFRDGGGDGRGGCFGGEEDSYWSLRHGKEGEMWLRGSFSNLLFIIILKVDPVFACWFCFLREMRETGNEFS